MSEAAVEITVQSGGCTEKTDFRLIVKELEILAEIAIVRVKPDNCKGFFPMGVTIEFPLADISLSGQIQKITISNPIAKTGMRSLK
ncbi:hypothetical protein [Roseibium polysiphoniae]|uniref:hypothetical protein n=1 Tax=Roseibium polysiphoniae TaxID=2571221 RepID=UPI001BCCF175|nr:hypothetical protein [Roseibium polysiphoniae]